MIQGELIRSADQEQQKLLHKSTNRNQCHESDTTQLPLNYLKKENLSDVISQGRCGSCWANSTIGMIQDRILKNKHVFKPNIQDALGTSMNDSLLNGCNGGDPFTLLQKISEGRGLTNIDGDKKVYLSDNICLISNEKVHQCSVDFPSDHEKYLKCINEDSRNIDSESLIKERTINMKKEIFNKGPIVCSINALSCDGKHDDDKSKSPLKSYTKNAVIYEPKCNITPNHAVEIVGWEQDSKEKNATNWIIKNSWGKNYGDDGYFKIRAGENILGIENECSAAHVEKINFNEQGKNGSIMF